MSVGGIIAQANAKSSVMPYVSGWQHSPDRLVSLSYSSPLNGGEIRESMIRQMHNSAVCSKTLPPANAIVTNRPTPLLPDIASHMSPITHGFFDLVSRSRALPSELSVLRRDARRLSCRKRATVSKIKVCGWQLLLSEPCYSSAKLRSHSALHIAKNLSLSRLGH